MKPPKGYWGCTEMLRYAKAKGIVSDYISDDSAIKRMRKALAKLDVEKKNGLFIFKESYARKLVEHDLRPFFEFYKGKSGEELKAETLRKEAEEAVKPYFERTAEEPAVFTTIDGHEYCAIEHDEDGNYILDAEGRPKPITASVHTGRYAEIMDSQLQAQIDAEEGVTVFVSKEEEFYAEMRFLLDYILKEMDGDKSHVFDRDAFQQDYRRQRQAEFDEGRAIEANDESIALEARELAISLDKKLHTFDAYIATKQNPQSKKPHA